MRTSNTQYILVHCATAQYTVFDYDPRNWGWSHHYLLLLHIFIWKWNATDLLINHKMLHDILLQHTV
jgi:hypothetical protein